MATSNHSTEPKLAAFPSSDAQLPEETLKHIVLTANVSHTQLATLNVSKEVGELFDALLEYAWMSAEHSDTSVPLLTQTLQMGPDCMEPFHSGSDSEQTKKIKQKGGKEAARLAVFHKGEALVPSFSLAMVQPLYLGHRHPHSPPKPCGPASGQNTLESRYPHFSRRSQVFSVVSSTLCIKRLVTRQ